MWTATKFLPLGVIQTMIYKSNPCIFAAFKAAIKKNILKITYNECARVISNFVWHIQLYFQFNDGNLGHVF